MPEVNLGKVVGPKGSDGAQGPAGADGLSAYEQAQAGGYSGSELEFNQQLAGLSDGPFVPESDKGVASGVATLDSTGKVPSGQLPSMDYIPTSQKGAASGVASLDATGKLEETQKPDYTASEVGAVPTTRTVNGKSLSADVVLTGDDIKTSATDNTTLSSQLSNKLSLSGGTMAGAIDWGNNRHISGSGTSTDFDFHAGKVAIRLSPENAVGNDISKCVNIRDTGNGALYPIATATPPQEYDLPLAEGITEIQPCTYHKNQFNEVTIHFNGQGTITEAMLLGTLPEGFRPAKIYDIPAVYRTADGYHAGGIVLWTDGTITTHVSIPSAIGCIFSASFIATS